MLVIVAGGYWFTVRPVFQNQLLQERNAQLELEINENEERLSVVDEKIAAEESERDVMLSELARERLQKDKLTSALRELEDRESELRARVAASQSELDATSSKLKMALWDLFYNDLQLISFSGWLTYRNLLTPNDWSNENINVELISEPNAYQNLRDGIIAIREDQDRYPGYPREFFEIALAHLDSRREFLVCDLPDYSALQAEYTERRAGLEPEIEKGLQAELEKHREEAAAEGHGVRFTDEFVRVTRASIRVGLEYSLQTEYSAIVSDAARACSVKRDAVIREFASLL